MTDRELLDTDGENRAVRTFLQLYGATSSITLKDMCRHLEASGFDGYWPEWVADTDDRTHLTKGGAQNWLRYLFGLEQAASAAPQQEATVDRNAILEMAASVADLWQENGRRNFRLDMEWAGNRIAKQIRDLKDAPASAAPQEPAFPERDPSKPAEQQGLFRKFEVRRVDGSDQPGGKHYGCRYYVLDLDHDKHAPAAMRAYAAACKDTHPDLAADIEAEFGAAPQPAQPQAGQEISVDVSAGDADAGSRIFARLTGEDNGGVWLAEETSRNFGTQQEAGQANTLGGFRGGFVGTHGRAPSEQEIWNAAVQSGMRRTAPAVPEGFKLVPVEPDAMQVAHGEMALLEPEEYPGGSDVRELQVIDVYRAMINAAPAEQK